ncbi:MAG: RNA ligase [Myxococcales bacterium]|nr:RNA ligase [Myxococcales bacterium]
MRHRAFPKIPLVLAQTEQVGGSWVATEKIHGAQLVLASDGVDVAIGKRKAWLAADEPFFGWQLLRAELSAALLRAHRNLDRGGLLYVYGELFGGHYPHPQIEALPGLAPVQTGIDYAPDLRFAAFDMLHVFDDEERFLAHEQVETLAAAAGLATVPVLGRGSRHELVQLPVRYPSRVPEQLGLPALPGEVSNLAEGYVLKPDLELAPARRPVVKHKIPEFDDSRFGESMPFDHHAHLSLAELLRWAALMFNPARLASARSKVGEDPRAIVEELVLDVWIDLEAIYPRRMLALADDEEHALRAGLEGLAVALASATGTAGSQTDEQ